LRLVLERAGNTLQAIGIGKDFSVEHKWAQQIREMGIQIIQMGIQEIK
jgi:hypothetical protein